MVVGSLKTDTGCKPHALGAKAGRMLDRSHTNAGAATITRSTGTPRPLAEDHRLRFSTLRKEVDGVTQRMLTLTLRNLERDGLVARHYFPEVPPRVEYELTEMGGGALLALEGFNLWVRDNLHSIKEHRRAYDEAKPQNPVLLRAT